MIELDLKRKRGSFNLHAKCVLTSPVTGLFGPSGAGKSSLLAMIAGLSRPDSGYIAIDGEALFDSEQGINVPAHQRRIGVVFQESRLFPHLNVHDNLDYGFKLLAPQNRQFEFNQITELLEISPLLKQKPHQLSGGEKQRVALGRALLTSPRLLLLDEPLASLDTRLKHQILPFLRRIKDELDIPMLYVSHAIDEVLYLTSQVAMIDKGTILAAGQFDQVMQDQRVLALTHSLGLENLLSVTVIAQQPEHGYTTATINGHANSPVQLNIPIVTTTINQQVSVSIAASNIALSTHKVEGVTIQNQLPGTVTTIQHVGSKTLVSVNVGRIVIAEVTAKAVQDLQIHVGAEVFCLVKTQSIRPLVTSI